MVAFNESVKILQWNARSYNTNGRLFRKLVEEIEPTIIAIQETQLKIKSKHITIPGYNVIRKDKTNITNGTTNGLAFFIDNRLTYQELNLSFDSKELDKQGIQIDTKRFGKINIFNIYNPPRPPANMIESLQSLHEISDKYPQNSIYVGDFNCHNEQWGCNDSDTPSRQLINWLEDNNLCYLNTGESTRYNITHNTSSTIDLSISSHRLASHANCEVIQDTCGSDHFPVLTTLQIEPIIEELQLPKKFIKDKANWPKFADILSNIQQNDIADQDANIYLENIQNTILSAAMDSIPRTSGRPKRRKTNPAWTQHCTDARKASRRAFKDLKAGRIDKTQYNSTLKNTKKVIQNETKQHWQEYVSTLNKDSNIRHVWNKIKTLNGKAKSAQIPTLKGAHADVRAPAADITATTSKEKAEVLAKTFASASSDNNLDPEHAQYRQEFHNIHGNILDNTGPDIGPLNVPFNITELTEALMNKKDSASGADQITYYMLKHIPDNFNEILLHFYNQIYTTGDFPSNWREATVIPLPKPGKDKHEPQNYRPISLTSHLCKTMETMVTNRLKWYLETKGILGKTQSGFRNGRSTLDHLVKLETDIRCALDSGHMTGAVFLDISKAFDLVWHQGLLYKVKDYGITGKILKYIAAFLTDRKIQVSVNQEKSSKYNLENGTPQGSVISPTLFNIMVSDLVKYTHTGEDEPWFTPDLSQFADDNKLTQSSRKIQTITNQLQKSLDAVSDWSTKWGFKLSKEKTVAMLFTKVTCKYNGKSIQENKQLFNLYLQGEPLQTVDSYKFLGITFDEHLTFRKHIEQLAISCQNATNLMRSVAGTNYGADKPTLLMLYKSLIRSRIDYGCMVYNSGNKTDLAKLDKIQYTALRIALGAYPSTNSEALLVEAGEKSLELRRAELGLKYWARICKDNDNPATEILNNRHVKYHNHANITNKWDINGKGPFGYRIYTDFQHDRLKDLDIIRAETPKWPPWLLHRPIISTEISNAITKQDLPAKIKAVALDTIDRKYGNFNKIYTDGSKDPITGKTSAAYYDSSSNEGNGYRCTDDLSIFSTELIAISKALEIIAKTSYKNVVILSDSLSALKALHSRRSSRPDLVHDVLYDCHLLISRGCNVSFEWTPAHVDITGNEHADKLAKNALDHTEIECKIPLSPREVYPIINTLLNRTWTEHINDNNLPISKIKENPLQVPFKYHTNLKYDKMITRLRLNRTLLNGEFGQYVFKNGPECEHCGTKQTTEHILLHCPALQTNRNTLINNLSQIGITNFSLKGILSPHKSIALKVYDYIIQYLKETGLTHRI